MQACVNIISMSKMKDHRSCLYAETAASELTARVINATRRRIIVALVTTSIAQCVKQRSGVSLSVGPVFHVSVSHLVDRGCIMFSTCPSICTCGARAEDFLRSACCRLLVYAAVIISSASTLPVYALVDTHAAFVRLCSPLRPTAVIVYSFKVRSDFSHGRLVLTGNVRSLTNKNTVNADNEL